MRSSLFIQFLFVAVSEVAGHITPVPGGVGPMTVAMLMKNSFDAAVELARESEDGNGEC